MTLSKALTYLWLAMLAATAALWIVDPTRFTQEALAGAIGAWGPWALLVFSLVALCRGALLLPSTPVILAGGVLFPGATTVVFLVSMAGIVASATLLYRFPGFAGYDTRLAARYPEQLARLQVHLRSPVALWFVALWAFLPVVPTDLICYAAGLVRMPFRRMMLGIIIGEVPLVAAYVFIGTRVSALW
ncbi:MAG TPA: VTT domain-containing protein [Gemmatimonadaceae bacterium]|nr:VTT domain-containing protein [Gemmatimonadaceae bacterium]